MSGFSGSPRVTKGYLASLDLSDPSAKMKTVAFQYNPDSLSRTITAQGVSGSSGVRTEAYRLKGPPAEKISLDIEIDATDQLEHPDQNPIATSNGIYPQLSALELMIYPPSSIVSDNESRLSSGTLEIIPPEGPFTIFGYGDKKVLPVRLTDLHITEEAHDNNLNPIRAKISINLQVLTYADLVSTHPGYRLSFTNQVKKEQMAASGMTNSPSGFSASLSPG